MADLNELIVYAEPGGLLGARCDETWADLSAAELATTAQDYPPHVSLTGFFRRSSEHLAATIQAVHTAIDSAAPAGLDGVRWTGPARLAWHTLDDWSGLFVEAPWMEAIAAALVGSTGAAPASTGEDAIRPKSDLHVSIAYGHTTAAAQHTLGLHHERFAELDHETQWTIALWRRTPGGWDRLFGVDVTAGG